MNSTYQWKPENIIDGNLQFAVMVLNTRIRQPPRVVINLWQNACIRCTVDGGTNRWRKFLQEQCDQVLRPPDYITGDFDSITEETKRYFKEESINYVHTPDQDATDFTKALDVLQPVLKERSIEEIIVLHDTSGRFDHIMANINTLFKRQCRHFNIYLIGGNSMTWLLRPGQHSISVPRELVEQRRWCALIPIGSDRVVCTTQGLRWDLCNGHLQFGQLVSTSNTYAQETVQVNADNCIIWSMGVFDFEDE